MFNCHNFTYSMDTGQKDYTQDGILKLFNTRKSSQKKDIPIVVGISLIFSTQ
jgi:hypothetical protein